MVKFCNTDVFAFKVVTQSTPSYLNIEWKSGQEVVYFLLGASGDRVHFRLPLYVE